MNFKENNIINSTILTSKKVMFFYYLLVTILVLSAFYYISKSELTFGADAVYYNIAAEHIANGDGFYSETKSTPTKAYPIIPYMPLYSYILAFFKFFTRFSNSNIIKISNFIIWFSFFISWILIYKKLFKKNIIVFISVSFLLFSSGLWNFLNTSLSEPIFIFLITVWINILIKYQKQDFSNYYQFLVLLILSIMITLTRKIGHAVAFSFIIFLFIEFIITKQKKYFIQSFLFAFLYLLGVGTWLYRNYINKNDLFGNIGKTVVSYSKLEKFFYSLNWSIMDSLGLPSIIETITVLFTLLILFIFLKITLYKNRSQIFEWIILFLIIYIGTIVLYSTFIHFSSRSGGYMRYYSILQPIIIPLILYIIIKIDSKIKVERILKYFFIALIFLSFISSTNRTKNFFISLEPAQDNASFFEQVEKTLKPKDFLLGNHYQPISIYSGHFCKGIADADHIKRLMLMPEIKYNKAYLVLAKKSPFSKPYVEILENTKHKFIIENENYIFVELDKESIFKEARK